MSDEIKEILELIGNSYYYGNIAEEQKEKYCNYITNLQQENDRLNNIIKNLDKMFEFYFLGNLKYDQDTVNTIYIKYVKLKELKENNNAKD